MTERERLIQLIGEISSYEYSGMAKVTDEALADFLLASGVRVPPVAVGATVYEFRRKAIYRRTDIGINTKRMLEMAVSRGDDIYISAKPYVKSDFPRIGNTIFLTLEEAAEKLRILGVENAIEFR